MKQTVTLLTCAGILTGFVSSHAAEGSAKPASVLTTADRQMAEDQYLVPSPGDILSALQRSAKIDWTTLSKQIGKADASTKNSYPEDSRKALNLGMRVADAFVALEAHDKKQFESSTSAVDKLGSELSPNADLTAKRDEIRKLADDGKWEELSNRLEQVRFDYLRAFKAVPDEDSIILANLGGWLRGLDLVSGSLGENYSAEGTQVLRQADLISYLKARLGKLEAPASTSKEVALLKAKLPEIEALCTFAQDATLPQEKVQRLHQITTELVQAVQK